MGACSPLVSAREEGGGGRGEMAAPEQNNTRTLTFYINLLTRV